MSCPTRGFWFAPTLFTDVAPAHRIAAEEIFGPVVSVLTFRTQAEAIEKANSTPYGLAAGIWTDKGSKAFEVASALQAGVVWQNTYNHFDPTAAFGGYKESGFGREGGMSGLRPLRAGGLVSERLPVRKTYKLFVGGAFVRSESGRYDRAGEFNVPRGSRKDVRDAVAAARKAAARLGRADRLQPRADPLPLRRGARVAARGHRRAGRRGRRGDRRARPLRRLDRQAPARARRHQPGGRAVPVLLAAGADRRGRAWSRPTSRSCSASWPSWRPCWPPATPWSPCSRRRARCPASTSARCSASPTCRAAW